jgi:hypothetical protein
MSSFNRISSGYEIQNNHIIHHDGNNEWISIRFKLAMNIQSISYNIMTIWTIAFFIDYVKQMLAIDFNISPETIEIIEFGQEIPNRRAEDGFALEPSLETIKTYYVDRRIFPGFYYKTNVLTQNVINQPDLEINPLCTICDLNNELITIPCCSALICNDCVSNCVQRRIPCPFCRSRL